MSLADGAGDPGAFPVADECEPFRPEVLPAGADPGEARPFPDENSAHFRLAWGAGQDEIVVGWGQEIIDEAGLSQDSFVPEDLPAEQVVREGDDKRYVIPIGEPPHGQISVRFVLGGCPYILWLAAGITEDGDQLPGYTLEDAIAYAKDF